MRRLAPCAIAIAITIALGTIGIRTAAAGEESDWSDASKGLRARLVTRLSHVSNGTGIIAIYLELNTVYDGGTPLRVTVNGQSVKYAVVDAEGREVPTSGGPFSGPHISLPELVLPHDSSLRFRVGPQGLGIPPDQAALVDLGPSVGWVLPRDGRVYYLQAVLEIPRAKLDRSKKGRRWHGRLVLPRVRIPTEPEPLDPATVGPLIEKLGARMVAKGASDSRDAMHALSLIDDPRVIPWYVKAVKSDVYSLRFNALDRLCRLEGDAALEGLRIGMATQGEALGHCSTPGVAASSAENIRHKAASALARSPHPQSNALLLTMEEDPAMSVRLAVAQAAARMTTAESLALLKRRTQDPDGTVRGEAARLLKLRERGGRALDGR